MFELRGVRKSFDGTEILHGVDLTIRKRTVTAIIGPSGSGKTTLLRCANFLERAEAGTLTFFGAEYDLPTVANRQIAEIRKRTGFVFQDYNLFRNRTVLGNVTEGLRAGRGIPREEAEEKAREQLRLVGMGDKLDAYPSQLSGGQQQRVAIARAMALDPDIVFFDEPTSALDPELTVEVLDAMRQVAESGTTMVVVTHEMAFARQVADRVVFMEDGHIVAESDSRSFFENPSNERVTAFLRMEDGWVRETTDKEK